MTGSVEIASADLVERRDAEECLRRHSVHLVSSRFSRRGLSSVADLACVVLCSNTGQNFILSRSLLEERDHRDFRASREQAVGGAEGVPVPSTVQGSGRGDAFAGGCLALILLLLEIPVVLLLILKMGLEGWARSSDSMHVGTPPMDWAPVLWFCGYTLAVLLVAVALLRWAHPLAGVIQMVVVTAALIITITAWRAEYERAHPSPLPTCPTRAGVPCAPENGTPSP
ncbi:DUF6234 family protein [Streptomyces sp. NPDC005813]|uniref:DUF6234 family protein n=1 Tax=Streptomyces sp. NPDC005813 TaxID=3155592 RepID=UPI0033FA6391